MSQKIEVEDLIGDAFGFIAHKCADVGALGHTKRGRKLKPLEWVEGLPIDANVCEALNEIGWRVLYDPSAWRGDDPTEWIRFNLHLLRLRDIGVEYERKALAGEIAA